MDDRNPFIDLAEQNRALTARVAELEAALQGAPVAYFIPEERRYFSWGSLVRYVDSDNFAGGAEDMRKRAIADGWIPLIQQPALLSGKEGS